MIIEITNKTPDLIIVPFEILSDDRLTLRQIRVLMAIFSWRKKNTSLARVSRDLLAERTGYPLTRISQITTELEALGWIAKTGNGGKSQWSEYRIKDIETTLKTKPNSNQNGNDYQNSNSYQNGNDTVTDSVSNDYQNGNDTVTELVTGIDTGIVQRKLKTEIVQRDITASGEKLSSDVVSVLARSIASKLHDDTASRVIGYGAKKATAGDEKAIQTLLTNGADEQAIWNVWSFATRDSWWSDKIATPSDLVKNWVKLFQASASKQGTTKNPALTKSDLIAMRNKQAAAEYLAMHGQNPDGTPIDQQNTINGTFEEI